MRFNALVGGAAIVAVLLTVTPGAFAELKVEGQAILFYTDDVGVFSATRRLSRDGDPTQPAAPLINHSRKLPLSGRFSYASPFLFYIGRVSTDQVAGFTSAALHPVSRTITAPYIKDMFKKIQAKARKP